MWSDIFAWFAVVLAVGGIVVWIVMLRRLLRADDND